MVVILPFPRLTSYFSLFSRLHAGNQNQRLPDTVQACWAARRHHWEPRGHDQYQDEDWGNTEYGHRPRQWVSQHKNVRSLQEVGSPKTGRFCKHKPSLAIHELISFFHVFIILALITRQPWLWNSYTILSSGGGVVRDAGGGGRARATHRISVPLSSTQKTTNTTSFPLPNMAWSLFSFHNGFLSLVLPRQTTSPLLFLQPLN